MRQRSALEARGNGQVKKIEDGGSDIDQAAELILGGAIGGPMKDYGDMQSALINEVTVTLLAVITESFAVI